MKKLLTFLLALLPLGVFAQRISELPFTNSLASNALFLVSSREPLAYTSRSTSFGIISNYIATNVLATVQSALDSLASDYRLRDTIVSNGLVELLNRSNSLSLVQALKILDVREFGAKGDGVNDDTEAIQAALDAAATSGGGIVHFPKGTYLVANKSSRGQQWTSGGTQSQLVIWSNNVYLVGQGIDVSVIKGPTNQIGNVNMFGSGGNIGTNVWSGSTNFGFFDLTIDQNSFGGNCTLFSRNGLLIVNRVKFKNTFTDAINTGWSGDPATSLAIVKDCVFENIGANAIRITDQNAIVDGVLVNGAGTSTNLNTTIIPPAPVPEPAFELQTGRLSKFSRVIVCNSRVAVNVISGKNVFDDCVFYQPSTAFGTNILVDCYGDLLMRRCQFVGNGYSDPFFLVLTNCPGGPGKPKGLVVEDCIFHRTGVLRFDQAAFLRFIGNTVGPEDQLPYWTMISIRPATNGTSLVIKDNVFHIGNTTDPVIRVWDFSGATDVFQVKDGLWANNRFKHYYTAGTDIKHEAAGGTNLFLNNIFDTPEGTALLISKSPSIVNGNIFFGGWVSHNVPSSASPSVYMNNVGLKFTASTPSFIAMNNVFANQQPDFLGAGSPPNQAVWLNNITFSGQPILSPYASTNRTVLGYAPQTVALLHTNLTMSSWTGGTFWTNQVFYYVSRPSASNYPAMLRLNLAAAVDASGVGSALPVEWYVYKRDHLASANSIVTNKFTIQPGVNGVYGATNIIWVQRHNYPVTSSIYIPANSSTAQFRLKLALEMLQMEE